MNKKPVIKILIVEDHDYFRKSLIAFLTENSDMMIVGQSGNGKEAVLKFCKHKPDLVIMDIEMPLLNGIDAAGKMKDNSPEIPIILYSMNSKADYKGNLDIADRFLQKDKLFEELIDTIRSLI